MLTAVVGAAVGSLLTLAGTYYFWRKDRKPTRSMLFANAYVERRLPPAEGQWVFELGRMTIENRGGLPCAVQRIGVQPDGYVIAGLVNDAASLHLGPGETHDLQLRARFGAMPPTLTVSMDWIDEDGSQSRSQPLTVNIQVV